MTTINPKVKSPPINELNFVIDRLLAKIYETAESGQFRRDQIGLLLATYHQPQLSLDDFMPCQRTYVENTEIFINILTIFILFGQEHLLERLKSCADVIQSIKLDHENRSIYALCLLIAILKLVAILDDNPSLKCRLLTGKNQLIDRDWDGIKPSFMLFDEAIVSIISVCYGHLRWLNFVGQKNSKLFGEIKNLLRSIFRIMPSNKFQQHRRQQIIAWLKSKELSKTRKQPSSIAHYETDEQISRDINLGECIVRNITFAIFQTMPSEDLVQLLTA